MQNIGLKKSKKEKSYKPQVPSLTAGPGDDRMNLERNNMDNTDIDDISNDNLRRIADAMEEILRLVKKDMEPREKKKN